MTFLIQYNRIKDGYYGTYWVGIYSEFDENQLIPKYMLQLRYLKLDNRQTKCQTFLK